MQRTLLFRRAPSALRVLVMLMVVVGAAASPVNATRAATNAARVADSPSTNRILVHYQPGKRPEAIAGLEASIGGRLAREIPELHVRVLEVPSAAAENAISVVRRSDQVDYAERDVVLQAQDNLPDDPSFPQAYSVGGGAWGWTMTHTTQAWDITQGNANVVVAILDTGIKTAGLGDFAGQISSTWNVLNGTSDATTNAGNHGTYVAGIVGLALGNNIGSAGFCPGCRVMIIQVGTDSGAFMSDIASGLVWAADHGARVANMSCAGAADSSTMQSATSYAHSKGVVMTAAAGNSNCDCVTYPAADSYVLGVAGVDNAGNKAGDSNYGSWVSVAAPEGNMTAWPSINGAPGYAPVGGTSSAAPVVAGIAGLLFSANPALTNTQVEQALVSTAVPASFSVRSGRIDALAALASLGFADPQASSAPLNSVAPLVMVETNGDWNYQPLTAAPRVGQVMLRGQGSWTGSAPMSLATVQWQRCDSTGVCSVAATTAKYTVQATDSGYGFRIAITVANEIGSASAISAISAPVGTAPSPLPSPSPSPVASPSPSPSPSPVPVGTTQTFIFSGSLNPANPSRTFTVTVGAGLADARLSFSKCSSLTLAVVTPGGASVSTSGPSVVVLDSSLAAATYTYQVSGGRCSFTLTVT